MYKLYRITIFCAFLLLITASVFGQQSLVSAAKQQELNDFSSRLNSAYVATHAKAIALAKSHGWTTTRKTKNGGVISLQGINSLGFPVYLTTHNNTDAAATTGTNLVQPGGSLGLNLSGSSNFLNNKLAMWDGGWVYPEHQEFAGKTISFKDTSDVIDHATHVAGTLMAKGIYAPAKGMAFNANTLISYDFNNDVAEMSKAAPGLLLSNHSYGDVAGWNYNDLAGRWEWYGLPGDTVDYNFGFYNSRVQAWDQIAYNAPYYLIVESAGNSRSGNGPAVGADYYGYASRTNQTLVDKGPRPATISNNADYDIITTTGTAKNILTVGAVNTLPNGPANSQGIVTTYFSSWGPTDDGRIKPDLVADGLNVLSSGSDSPTAYSTESGTSFSAPNVTGSLYLLQEYYAQKNSGAFMRAATLKGLACHTAFDAGNIGPDYIYGWGLLDMPRAAQAITDNGTKSLIRENNLIQNQQQTFTLMASGNGPLSVTISWTDPQGTPTPEGTVNSRTPKLVNDLDMRISDGTNTFKPWVLDPDNPANAATTGDNIRDNIEQVYIPGAVPGRTYTVTISNKGVLQSGSQAYSLIATGIGGTGYCTSGPLSNADSRINNVTVSNLNNTPPPGCTGYSDYTGLTTVALEQGKSYPLAVTLGTCGNNFNKAAKVYIDWNGNGVFDANELVATTTVMNGTGTYTANISVPSTVTPNNYSLMRVVLTETSDTSTITACGTYGKGETQDYRVQFLQASIDAGVTAIVSPAVNGTCNGPTPITVTLKNFGSTTLTNIPLTVTVKSPDNTITTINETYTGTLAPLAQGNYTFNGTFNAISGSTYTVTAAANLANDPVLSNNQITAMATIITAADPASLTAAFCTNSNQYLLTGTGDGELLWYQHAADSIPFAFGASTLTSQSPVNNTYYASLNDFSGTAGPATKSTFSVGGYDQFTPSVNITTEIPVIIQSARLYIGNPGTITFNVTNSNGQVVASTTINAAATRTNPQPGTQPDDPNDQGKVYNLNLLLPAAGNYTITPVYDNSATMYRNNGGVSGYPFKIGNLFSITRNSAVSTSLTDTAYYKNFYYYFYDLQIRSAGCASATRQPVTVLTPVITQTGTILSSNFLSGNQWYLNGITIKGATGQTYTPTQSGNYQVYVTLSNGCISASANFVYLVTAINTGAGSEIGLVAFPVPASDLLNVIFVVKVSNSVNIALLNSMGQTVYTNTQTLLAGNFSTLINVANLSPGTYLLRVLTGQKIYAHKVIIVR
jgi:hypothetical protein